ATIVHRCFAWHRRPGGDALSFHRQFSRHTGRAAHRANRSRVTGGAPSFSTTLAFMVLALLVTLLAAELLYRCIEKPSVELAKRLKGSHGERPAAISVTRLAA